MPGHLQGPALKGAALTAHKAGILSNLALIQAAATALGDIPLFLSPAFFEHGPDERAVVLFVSYLCCRLLEVSREDRAAQTIQSLYRSRNARQPGAQLFAVIALVTDVICHSLVMWGNVTAFTMQPCLHA